jgi:ArsR family transcriptional regulator, arsenate/arsenite/antimonite-responsive transcriptional repressor
MLQQIDRTVLRPLPPLDSEVRTLGGHLEANSELFSSLADPVRQALVQVLAREELNVGDVAARVTLSRPTVSHHLKLLRRAGIVRARKSGREIYYSLNKDHIVSTLAGLLQSLTCC